MRTKLGRVGDFQRQIAEEMRALEATPKQTASECDLLAAKKEAAGALKMLEVEAVRLFCP